MSEPAIFIEQEILICMTLIGLISFLLGLLFAVIFEYRRLRVFTTDILQFFDEKRLASPFLLQSFEAQIKRQNRCFKLAFIYFVGVLWGVQALAAYLDYLG